jgi:5-hydroxyisourate hydrolase-like protein (transthyretin family)
MSVFVHVVDYMFGRPAVGVAVRLFQPVDTAWREVSAVATDATGVATWHSPVTNRGRYQISLSLDQYFAGFGVEPLQSRLEVTFRVFRIEEVIRIFIMITPASCCVYDARAAFGESV